MPSQKRIFSLKFFSLFKQGVTDEQANLYDLVFKAIGVFGVLGAFFWGIWQYKITAERDFQKELYVEQIGIMNRCIATVSTLAIYPEGTYEYKKANLQFKAIEIGELNLFADDSLEILFSRFKSHHEAFQNLEDGIIRGKLETDANDISDYCHRRIERLTKLDL